MSDKTISYYRKLPYRRVVTLREEPEGRYFVASVDELPALKADGATREGALLRLDENFDDFIQAQIEWGEEIPEPLPWPGVAGLPLEPAYEGPGYATEVEFSIDQESVIVPPPGAALSEVAQRLLDEAKATTTVEV